MKEYAVPEGYRIENHVEEYGHESFDVMKGDIEIGHVYWHGRYQALAKIDTDQGEQGNLALGYMADPQACIYALTGLFSEGTISLPAIVQELGKGKSYYSRYLKVMPWSITAFDGKGGFNLKGHSARGWQNGYAATITKTSDGRWRAAWFDYGLTPMQIAASMQVLTIADTRQACIDKAIATIMAELAAERAAYEAASAKKEGS